VKRETTARWLCEKSPFATVAAPTGLRNPLGGPTEKLGAGTLAHNGLKDTQQGLLKLIVQVVLCVKRNVVLQHVNGVLRLFKGGRALSSLFKTSGRMMSSLREE